MSSAFIKEEVGERWTPPAALPEYRVLLDGVVVHETDDLPDTLRWILTRPGSGFELRNRENVLLARDF